jgi:two-component system, NtrC family, nitrogen regulation sensor histidine kinase NtrY
MVNEFSSFARMPKPQPVVADIGEALREAVFLQTVAKPDISFTTDLPAEPVHGRFDQRLLSQAFINVVKNAGEAVEAARETRTDAGRVEVRLARRGGEVVVEVIDDGVGLPSENRARLLEPYVTTREKGTGLGLAIVRKIIEDHGGRIELLDAPAVASGGHGAMVRFRLPFADVGVADPAAVPSRTAAATAVPTTPEEER